jgi:hypothetical protein
VPAHELAELVTASLPLAQPGQLGAGARRGIAIEFMMLSGYICWRRLR